MSLSSTWGSLYNAVMAQDRSSQLSFLDLIGAQVRQIDTDTLVEEQALFIPNEDYVHHFVGDSAMFDDNGFYRDGISIWHDYVIFPIRGLDNSAKGIGGFCPRLYLQAKETGDYSLNYYSYTTKNLFNKGDYLFWGIDGFEKAYKDGYVIVVDGMFDAIQLRRFGYNAVASMGSTLTAVIIAQLRFFKKVIIMSDNDEAGYKLEQKMKRQLHNCIFLRQGYNKDIDGAIKEGYSDIIFKELDKMIAEPFYIDHVVRA